MRSEPIEVKKHIGAKSLWFFCQEGNVIIITSAVCNYHLIIVSCTQMLIRVNAKVDFISIIIWMDRVNVCACIFMQQQRQYAHLYFSWKSSFLQQGEYYCMCAWQWVSKMATGGLLPRKKKKNKSCFLSNLIQSHTASYFFLLFDRADKRCSLDIGG